MAARFARPEGLGGGVARRGSPKVPPSGCAGAGANLERASRAAAGPWLLGGYYQGIPRGEPLGG